MSETDNFKRILVTSALPYANGPIHVGHIAGAYLPADIYCRYQRLKGRDVLYICGSDEYGVAIMIKARQEGKTPQEVVDEIHPAIKLSFEKFGMSFDYYGRTSSENACRNDDGVLPNTECQRHVYYTNGGATVRPRGWDISCRSVYYRNVSQL